MTTLGDDSTPLYDYLGDDARATVDAARSALEASAVPTEPERPKARSLVCSIGKHTECDGNAPNGPAGVGYPCSCACHPASAVPVAARPHAHENGRHSHPHGHRLYRPLPANVIRRPIVPQTRTLGETE